jgi:hypothetical protein
LRELKELQTLDLSQTKVTDAGKELKGLNKLTYLNVARTQVTDAGINEIKEALPGLEVDRHLQFFDLDFEYKPRGLQQLRDELHLQQLRDKLPGWLLWVLGPTGLFVLGVLGSLLDELLREPSTDKSGKSASPRPVTDELGLGVDGQDGVWRREGYPWQE